MLAISELLLSYINCCTKKSITLMISKCYRITILSDMAKAINTTKCFLASVEFDTLKLLLTVSIMRL